MTEDASRACITAATFEGRPLRCPVWERLGFKSLDAARAFASRLLAI